MRECITARKIEIVKYPQMKVKYKSIRFQITLTLVLVMALFFVLFAYVASERLKPLSNIFVDQYVETATARAHELGNEIRGMQDQVEMIALSEAIETMELENVRPFLLSISRQNKFRNFTIAWPDGQAWATYDQFIDISNQEQFHEIFVKQQASYISRPFYSPFIPENIPIITMSHVVMRDNEIVGLVNGVVSTSFIKDLVASITLQHDGFAWIIDDRGQVLVYPDDDITIDSTFEAITAIDFNHLIQSDSKTFAFTLDQVEYISLYATIPHTNGWNLILSFDRIQFFAWINALVNYLYVSFVITLIILIFVLLLSTNAVLIPLLKLKKNFDDVGMGNLDIVADESVPNEIGEAAISFNSMLHQIKELTFTDTITGLNNFFSFVNMIPKAHQIVQNSLKHELYIVILSIDDFKRINSLYGYDVGNETLRALSKLIQPYLNDEETIARYFGDEMILSLIAPHEKELIARIEALRSVLKKPIVVQGIDIYVHVSFGVARYDASLGLSDVVRHATMAKQKSKTNDSSKITVYSDLLFQELMQKQAVEEALQTALLNNEFYLVYQSVYDVVQETVVGYEALLRWKHPFYQTVPIIDVINVAERTGIIHELGYFVLVEAAKQLKRLNVNHPKLKMSINVSPFQLQNRRFVDHVAQLVQDIGFMPQNFVLEVTESATMLDMEEKKDILERLKKLGFMIAIDDFGTGYSSLIYISKLPIDMIKIDRDFVSKIEYDEYSKVLIVSILSIAKALNYHVIAEGVETQAQADALKQLGCVYLQGYLISRPQTSIDK
jgi:diguanylate cyclase (GGDEF)-like protein